MLPIITGVAGVGLSTLVVLLLSHVVTIPSVAPELSSPSSASASASTTPSSSSAGTARRCEPERTSRRRSDGDEHLRSGRPLRRGNRGHRPPGHAGPQRRFPFRHGHRRQRDRRPHRRRRGHACSRRCWPRSDARYSRSPSGRRAFPGVRTIPPDRRRPRSTGGFFGGWAQVVQRRPVVTGGALVVLVALAAPFLSMRLGSADASSDPSGKVTRSYYDTMSSSFGDGFQSQLLLVAQTPNAHAQTAWASLVHELPAIGRGVGQCAHRAGGGTLSYVNVTPATTSQDQATTTLVSTRCARHRSSRPRRVPTSRSTWAGSPPAPSTTPTPSRTNCRCSWPSSPGSGFCC